MKVDKTTCWYGKDHYKQVKVFVEKEGQLITTKHGRVLKELIDLIPESEKEFLDIGCGACMVSEITDRNYTGVDLPDIITKLARVYFPSLCCIRSDIIEGDINFISKYDIVLMNAFIDIMQFPLETLNNILNKCKKYVIIHRQEIHNEETEINLNRAYGGDTYHSKINRENFLRVLKDFEILQEVDSGFGGNWRSFLLKRISI